jgi:regulator of PEP synthase PpsR (kinase-PPPase family)
MNKIYQIYLISDSTGETLDRIFLAIKAQFLFKCKTFHLSFTRTENQINNILSKCESEKNVIFLYTIVNNNIAKYLREECKKKNITSFEVLGNLINDFSKILNQKASREPSGQHALDDEYYKRIEAVQFTMSHDDGKKTSDIEQSDIVLVGVSRTSKTPTSIYLANRGYKTTNIALIPGRDFAEQIVEKTKNNCVVGLICDPRRLYDVRKNRVHSMHEDRAGDYTDGEKITIELEKSKLLFKKYNWPIIDVTRKSVEETAASVIKIFDILNPK